MMSNVFSHTSCIFCPHAPLQLVYLLACYIQLETSRKIIFLPGAFYITTFPVDLAAACPIHSFLSNTIHILFSPWMRDGPFVKVTHFCRFKKFCLPSFLKRQIKLPHKNNELSIYFPMTLRLATVRC